MSSGNNTDIVVRVRLQVDGQIPGIPQARREFVGLHNLVGDLSAGISAMLRSAFAAAAGGAGAGLLARSIVGIHSELQTAETGMASLMSALTGADIGTSLGVARAQIQGLRADAAAGAGELEHYVDAFGLLLSPVMTAGGSLDDVREMTRLSLAAGFALRGQEGLRLSPMDVQQALTQGVGDRTTPIVNQLLRGLGMSNEEFNAQGTADRLTTLREAFGLMSEGADLMSETWEARMATLRDSVVDLARTVTEPLFDAWSDQLARVNDWLEANRDRLREMALDLGPKLAGAYERIQGSAGTIAAGTAAATTAPVALRGGAAVAGAMGIGGMAAAGIAAAGLGGVGAALLSIRGAVRESPELLSSFAEAMGRFGDSLISLVSSVDTLFGEGSPLNVFGRSILRTATAVTNGLAAITERFAWFLHDLGEFGTLLFQHVQGTVTAIGQIGAGLATIARGDFVGGITQMGEAYSHTLLGSREAFFAGLQDLQQNAVLRLLAAHPRAVEGAGGGADDLPPVSTTITNFNGPVSVRIETEHLDDPNRVAGAFEQMVAKLRAAPVEARAQRLIPRGV